MKTPYEIGQFTLRYILLTGIFLIPILAAGLVCCKGNIAGILIILLLYLLFAVCAYLLFRKLFSKILHTVESVSQAMIDVVEGREDSAEELYLEGDLGVLHTNFYKMVSTLRESQMKAQEEKEFLRATISDISHQLKTPLSSLHVFVELLYEDKVSEAEKQKQILAEARNQLNRMEWMVLSMLKLARIEAGAVLFEKKSCSGAEIVCQAIESVRYLTDARRQTVHLQESDDQLPANAAPCQDVTFLCDKEWLTEALINLLKNASDYSGENTTITVSFEDNRLYSRIYVKDQGVGIPEEALPHIFERFYRVDHEVNPNSVGIGLSLTKSIVEGMGGRITVRSSVGEYTCFALTFMK